MVVSYGLNDAMLPLENWTVIEKRTAGTKNKYILERISVVTEHLLILQTYQAIVKPNPAPSVPLFAIEKSVTTTTKYTTK